MRSLFTVTFLVVFLSTTVAVKATSGRALRQTDPRSTCPAAVCEAVKRKDPNTLKRLIDAGQTTCFCTCDTRLLVRASVLSACTECIEHLITSPSNCDIDGRLFGGNSALHEAASICQIAVGDYLLRRGADVTAVNRGGYTPLCVASFQNNPDCGHVVRSMVNAGADLCGKCYLQTPIDHAVNDNVRNVLIQEGADKC